MEKENDERNGMLKVDPKLFITCRLCLDNIGLFQIVPKIQIQIKYCFDIEVELFDGLPPLICKQCESILSKYVAIKQMFQEKQNTLKTKLKDDWVNAVPEEEPVAQPAQETVSSTQQIESGLNTSSNEQEEEDKNSSKCISNTDSEDSHNNASTKPFIGEVKSSLKIRIKNWKANFVKHFACRFCTKTYKDKRSIHNHIKNKHSNLLSSHTNVFKKFCLVRLEKCDHKANIANSKKMVHMQNKIIQNKKAHYYISYIGKPLVNSDTTSTDEDEISVNRKKRKIQRLSSTSSTDTLLIDKNESCASSRVDQTHMILSEKEESSNEATNATNTVYSVDDSDSTMSSHSHKERYLTSDDQHKKLNNNDIITNIVSMCHARFIKKLEEAEDKKTNMKNKVDKASQIQHKVLSIGSKVINNRGFQCTGLLRYLEHKNLDVICIPKAITGVSKDSNYIRIKTKLREKKGNDRKNSGWQNFYDISHKDANLEFCDVLQKALVSAVNIVPEVSTQNIETPTIENEKIACIYDEDQAVLSRNGCSELEKLMMSQKLLNANPVANPKQLPKKTINTDTKTCYLTTNMASPIDDVPGANHMPIITSIESLASPREDSSRFTQHNTAVDKHKPAPKIVSRIKVKPVSELMPQKPEISNPNLFFQPTASSWNTNQLVSTHAGVMFMSGTNQYNSMNTTADVPQYTKIAPKCSIMPPDATFSISMVAPQQEASTPVTNNDNCVILHTVELPNKKTNSPFSYFKQLLEIHNIALLGVDEPLNAEAFSLIKFKLLFQQKLTTPVTLCLELFSDIKSFCITIRDCNLREIDINKLTANWQLEILEVFSRDITTVKVLNRAEKISPQMFSKTNYFISLLKSIQKVSEDMSRKQHLSDTS